MTPTEAARLADEITKSWPVSHVTADVWARELTPLDAGTAGTCLARLRREQPSPPSVHTFVTRYHELHTPANDPIGKCPDCDGNGWIQAPDLVHPDGRHTTQVEPCPTCSAVSTGPRQEPTR